MGQCWMRLPESGRRELLLRQLTEVEGSASCSARKPCTRGISVVRPHRCTTSAAPCFRAPMQVDFLKDHEIFDYSAADFELDRETLRELRMREARP
jgi:hypothetical protein